MSRINAIDAKKKRLRHRLENEAKKTSKDIEFYRYLKLIDIFE